MEKNTCEIHRSFVGIFFLKKCKRSARHIMIQANPKHGIEQEVPSAVMQILKFQSEKEVERVQICRRSHTRTHK